MTQGLTRTMVHGKIHRVTITGADQHYVGSITVDADLLDAADILPGQQVDVVDVDNGARLTTYTIAGERGSGVIQLNGAAALLVNPGDLAIIIAYSHMPDDMARTWQPHVVFVNEHNHIVECGTNPGAVPEDHPAAARHGLTSSGR